MTLLNEYTLNVDLKRNQTARVPIFRRGDTGVLIFDIFNDGVQYDISTATSATLYQKTKSGVSLTSSCEFVTRNNKRVIRYEFEDVAMVEIGYNTCILVIQDANGTVSVQPFVVVISDDLIDSTGSYIELIQDLNELLQSFESDLLNTIPLSEKGVPNGVSTLDENGKILDEQLPESVDTFKTHITETVFEHQVHGMRIQNGILQYETSDGSWQNVGFSPEAIDTSPFVSADVKVSNNVATIQYFGKPNVVVQKWDVGDRNISYFTDNGNVFTGLTFNLSQSGIHTLYYEDSNGVKYTKVFLNTFVNDITPPTLTLTAELSGLKTATVKAVATDDESGVDFITLPNDVIVRGSGAEYTVTKNGYLTFKATDVAGNETSQEIFVNLIDDYAPYITYTTDYPHLGDVRVGSIMITINYEDVQIRPSGIDYLMLPDGSRIEGGSTYTHELTSNGMYTYEVFDKAGNSRKLNVNVQTIGVPKYIKDMNIGDRFYFNGKHMVLLEKEADNHLVTEYRTFRNGAFANSTNVTTNFLNSNLITTTDYNYDRFGQYSHIKNNSQWNIASGSYSQGVVTIPNVDNRISKLGILDAKQLEKYYKSRIIYLMASSTDEEWSSTPDIYNPNTAMVIFHQQLKTPLTSNVTDSQPYWRIAFRVLDTGFGYV